MFDIGMGELLFIFVVFLLLFGPKSLPDLARKVAYGMNKIKQAQAEFQSQINSIQHEIQSTIDIDKEKAGIDIKKSEKGTPKPLETKGVEDQLGLRNQNSLVKDSNKDTSENKHTQPTDKTEEKDK